MTDTGRRDEMGGDLRAHLARTHGVAVQAEYTFTTADIEQGVARHEIDFVLDARVPAGAGPRIGGVAPFGGLGLGVVVAAQSGLPYTALQTDVVYPFSDPFTAGIRGTLNGERLPWATQVDLRLERRFALAARPSRRSRGPRTCSAPATRSPSTGRRAPRQTTASRPRSAARTFSTRPGRQFAYTEYTGGPVNVGGRQSTEAPYVYGQPRQVRLGLSLGI